MNDQEATYPPEPHWTTTPKGRFIYTDYDGESLHIRFEPNGDLWVDKKGEGAVYIRKEDVALIIAELQKGRKS